LTGRNLARLLRYVFTGGLTTTVSLGTFYVLYNQIGINPNAANVVSIICAVTFSYFANKIFVFQSKCRSISEVAREAFSFFASRAFTIFLELSGVFLMHSVFRMNAMLSKILIGVVIFVINFVVSHFVFFRRTRFGQREE